MASAAGAGSENKLGGGGGGDLEKGGSDGGGAQRGGSVLPFKPLTLTFRDMQYSVAIPKV